MSKGRRRVSQNGSLNYTITQEYMAAPGRGSFRKILKGRGGGGGGGGGGGRAYSEQYSTLKG